eukprot:6682976-Alexandrium_andersonii.AAC.1
MSSGLRTGPSENPPPPARSGPAPGPRPPRSAGRRACAPGPASWSAARGRAGSAPTAQPSRGWSRPDASARWCPTACRWSPPRPSACPWR